MRRVKKQRDLRSIESDKTLRKPSVTAVAAVFSFMVATGKKQQNFALIITASSL